MDLNTSFWRHVSTQHSLLQTNKINSISTEYNCIVYFILAACRRSYCVEPCCTIHISCLTVITSLQKRETWLSATNDCLNLTTLICQSQWPRGLRRRSTAARLLRLWVQIPPGRHGCLSVVSVVCCQVEISVTG